jgi:Na+/phosphate symporter
MNLYTAAILSFILFFGCVVSLGLSYDEEQMKLQKDESKSRDLVDSFTTGQYMFVLAGTTSGIAGSVFAVMGIIGELTKNG